MARSRLADQVGRVVGGRYRLLAPVGTGASADVYVADDVTLRRRVAVKVLHDALATDEGFLRRFRAEARAVASLRHPNIMAVFDWGEEVDGPFLVLEYLGGGSLRDLLDRGHRLSPSQAALVGLEAARGLDHAHRRGLVHRDVKPANLLFDDEGRLAIADFGIARALAEATWTEPAGAVVGTVRYASPEQARGNSLDGRADVYGLALVLVEAVTGTVPFAADTTIATLMARLDRPIAAPAALGALAPVIEAAGAVDPSDRIDAAGIIRAIDAAARDLPPPAPLPLVPIQHLPLPTFEDDATAAFAPVRPAPVPLAAAAPPAVVAPGAVVASGAEVLTESRPRWWRRWPWVVATVGVIVLGILAGLLLPGAVAPTYAVPNLKGRSATGLTARHFRVAVHPERITGAPVGVVLDQHPEPGGHHRSGTITVDVSIGNALVAVPEIGGAPLAVAQPRLEAAGFKAGTPLLAFSSTVPDGSVVDWSPKAPTPQGSAINLVVSKGPEMVTMPDLVSTPETVQQALAALQALGIPAGQVNQTQDFSPTVPKGDVISTTPPAGQQADRAGTVTLDVSKGPQTVKVPDVRNKSVGQATAILQAAGLTVGGVYGPGTSVVIDQTPSAGATAKVGSPVDLFAL
ncbi:MAG TPA: PASTA domain-containing protein [Acidimicrobiales bacterium]